VAVDSDIEQVLTPAGVMATQRALLQRQFVEQITGAFQLIKVCICVHCRGCALVLSLASRIVKFHCAASATLVLYILHITLVPLKTKT
jgi:hypothetical protein